MQNFNNTNANAVAFDNLKYIISISTEGACSFAPAGFNNSMWMDRLELCFTNPDGEQMMQSGNGLLGNIADMFGSITCYPFENLAGYEQAAVAVQEFFGTLRDSYLSMGQTGKFLTRPMRHVVAIDVCDNDIAYVVVNVTPALRTSHITTTDSIAIKTADETPTVDDALEALLEEATAEATAEDNSFDVGIAHMNNDGVLNICMVDAVEGLKVTDNVLSLGGRRAPAEADVLALFDGYNPVDFDCGDDIDKTYSDILGAEDLTVFTVGSVNGARVRGLIFTGTMANGIMADGQVVNVELVLSLPTDTEMEVFEGFDVFDPTPFNPATNENYALGA